MKRTFCTLLAALLCLTACAHREAPHADMPEAGPPASAAPAEPAPLAQPVPEPEPQPVWTAEGIAFSLLQDAYPAGTAALTLVIDNQSGEEISWGREERYEKFVDGAWVELAYPENTGFRGDALLLEPESVRTVPLSGLALLPPLDEGLYRVTGGRVWIGDEALSPWQVSFRVAADTRPEPDYAVYISSQPIPTADGCMVLDRLPVHLINTTGEDYAVLLIPRLEKLDGDVAWTEVPFREDVVGWCGMSDPLPAGVSRRSENTVFLWGSLEDGRYRLSYALGPDAAGDPQADVMSGEFTLYTPENSGGLPLAPQK